MGQQHRQKGGGEESSSTDKVTAAQPHRRIGHKERETLPSLFLLRGAAFLRLPWVVLRFFFFFEKEKNGNGMKSKYGNVN